MFKLISLPLLSLSLLGTTLAIQGVQSNAVTRVEGAVEPAYGSPVRLSDPSYRVVETDSKPKRLQLIGNTVTVENISGRRIRRLHLKFTFAHDNGGSVEGNEAVDRLAVGESRVLGRSILKMSWFASSNDLELTVRPTGAEFEDGSHWAAPRDVKHPLLRETLSQPRSHLIIRQLSWVNDSYEAVLEIGQERVVAYRLGVVKDTPNSFEVRIGKWIDLKEADGLKFTDNSVSLSPGQVFAREIYSLFTRGGKEITHPGGVAIFVAELRFANGRIWQQDTSRDALFWCN
jgi:hypothetical protein